MNAHSRTPSPNRSRPVSGSDFHPASQSGRSSSPKNASTGLGINGNPRDVTWASAQARSAQVKRYSNDPANKSSFFKTRLVRTLSASLPRFNSPARKDSRPRNDTSKRGQLLAMLRNLGIMLLRLAWRLRTPLSILLCFLIAITLFYVTPLNHMYKRSYYKGGGKKFVLILAANPGGGVMEWKGPREWAVERVSVANKKYYAKKWGYSLEIVDMVTKKRYAHEWRESWEKVDTIRRCMKEYPEAEWFWWLDLNTFIMEPSISLQKHIFNDLANVAYRNINSYNPLQVQHPPQQSYLDDVSRSAVGDGDPSSINLLLPQDCSGFTLGSFFMRRSAWSDRLLDMWWDPVHYEQRHMQWEHKEQDALEYLYRTHPWIRSSTAFLPQRHIASFPNGACGSNNHSIHYQRRDFMVSLAGCEWGRDCWYEIYQFRELAYKLQRNVLRKAFDGIKGGFKSVGRKFKKQEEKSDAPQRQVQQEQKLQAPQQLVALREKLKEQKEKEKLQKAQFQKEQEEQPQQQHQPRPPQAVPNYPLA